MKNLIPQYFSALEQLSTQAQASRPDGIAIGLDTAFEDLVAVLRTTQTGDGKIMFVGNGGSAGITSHMAIDFLRNGGMTALAFNDGAALTCLGNDFGYEQVFSRQVEAHGRPGDLLVAISSSGRSPNILRAVEAARTRGCRVLTLSGFAPDNPLRTLGDLNLYVASDQYGLVEVAHMALLHALLDLSMGWRGRINAGRVPVAAEA